MRNLKEYIIEGIFDIDNNEEKLDRNINIYKNAINIINIVKSIEHINIKVLLFLTFGLSKSLFFILLLY